jgi:site-specific DNA-methyltransferase (adenine-specific)
MKTTHKIIFGDSRNMSLVDDESVHLIVTSPPYWQLKDYGSQNQIGFDDTYEQYINNLNLVWRECFRTLHKGCRLCINIGDQFARSVYYGRYKIIPIRTEIIKFCETIGFDYMGAIIWRKVTTCNTTGGASIMGSFPYPRNGILKLDYEFILIFKKLGDAPKVDRKIKEKSKLTSHEWNNYFNGHWNFRGEKQNGHLAMFPEELPRRLIRMFTFVGDMVLDPFLGSATTTLAARNLLRNSIGYEINQDYETLIRQKLGLQNADFFNDSEYEFLQDASSSINYEQRINGLPYIFKDPVRFNKKIDVKKLTFGSKIDAQTKTRDGYYIVREILAPEKIRLNTGLIVKLMGVKTIQGNENAAVEFLNQQVRGKHVYLKFDTIKYDFENNLLGYVYLKNKTFINAHLIKHGFACVDNSFGITNGAILKYLKGEYAKRMDS